MLIAVCDDEKTQREKIKNLFKKMDNTIGYIVKEFISGDKLVDSYNKGAHFDIIILDIRMLGINGMEAAKKIRDMDKKAVIIFVTNLMDYALEGYHVNAYRYLIKPLNEDEFRQAINGAVNELSREKQMTYILHMKDNTLKKIDAYETLYVESFGRKVIFHMCSGAEIECNLTMSEIEHGLVPMEFMRIHKSYLVNMRYIEQVSKSNVVLHNDIAIPLSRRRQKVIYDEFTQYLVRCSQ